MATEAVVDRKAEILAQVSAIEHDPVTCCPGCRVLLEHVATFSLRFDEFLTAAEKGGISALMGGFFGKGRKGKHDGD